MKTDIPIERYEEVAESILNEVCEVFGATPTEVKRGAQSKSATKARAAFHYVTRAATPFKDEWVSLWMGRRKNARWYGNRAAKRLMAADQEFRQKVESLISSKIPTVTVK